MKKNLFLLFIAICMIISVTNDELYALEEVIIQTSSHSSPNTDTTIKVYFEYPNTAEIDGFYYTITTQPSHTITNDSILTNQYIALASDLGSTRGDGPYEDGYYYVYIAAYDAVFLNPPILGPTTKVGPLTVDTVPPVYIKATGSEITYTNTITLNLDSNEELSEICISEASYEDCDDWHILNTSNYDYTLSNGEKDYLLFIKVKDVAGNMKQTTSPFPVTYSHIVIDNAQCKSIPTLTQWGMFFFMSLLIFFGLHSSRQIST